MIDARMDGTLEERLMWRILALREALSDIETMRDGVTHQIARNGLLVDDDNAKLCASQQTNPDYASHGCKRAGGFVDTSCNAACDCHKTLAIPRPTREAPHE